MQSNQQQHQPAYASQSTSSGLHIWDYWAIVMKRILLVLVFAAVSLAIAYMATQRQQKLYRSTATIQILPPNLSGGDVMFTPAIINDEQYLATQLAILQTPETIQRAIKDQNLGSLPDFKDKKDDEIVRLALGHIECSRRRGLYLVDVSVTGTEPKVLDDLANALVKTFQSMQKSATRQLREDRKAQLDEKIQTADSQMKLFGIDRKNAMENANFDPTTFESEWHKIQESRERLVQQADLLYVEILRDEPVLNAFKAARQDPAKGLESLTTHPYILQNDRVKAVDRRITELRDQQNKLIRDGLGRTHPQMLGLNDEIEQVGRERSRIIEDIVNTFLLSYADKVSFRESLTKQIEQRTQEMKTAAQIKRTVDKIGESIGRMKVNKDAAIREMEILTQNATDEKDAVRIESMAVEAPTPYAPNSSTNYTLGLVFGVVGGIALAFLLDYLDDTIRTKDELAKVAPDVPLLGIVPNIEARKSEVAKKDLFAANQPKSTISEAYRGVRTALTLSIKGPSQKVMLLTSAGPREGKTTTVINLATVLAFSGARTLIVDADLRKPRIHASFGLPNKKGLTNLIVGEDDPAEYCQRTQIDRVDVLTSGPIPPNPSELLGRARTREIFRTLRERYDQIIVDTPPIGAVTDAAVISPMMDGVILVVHAGKTRRQIVSRGIEQLRYINAQIIGVILNNLQLGRGRYYPGYYHYYYYYASHYGSEDAKGKPAKGKTPAAPEAAVGTDTGAKDDSAGT